MASSSKKAHRPASKGVKAPSPAPEFDAPAAEVFDLPAPAVDEASAPEVDETSAAVSFEAPESQELEAVEPETAEAVEAPLTAVEAPAPEFAETSFEAAQSHAPEAVEPEAAKAVEAPLAAAADMTENVRAIVEKGVVEGRPQFAQAKTAAAEATAAVEASFGAARNGVLAFNAKAIEAIKAESDANFDMFRSLAAAKSMSDLVTLQAEFARKRFEDASSRAKELTELARKVADDTVAPIKAHVAKTFKIAV